MLCPTSFSQIRISVREVCRQPTRARLLDRSVSLQEEPAGSHTHQDAASPVAGNGRHELPAAAAEAEPTEPAVAEAERNVKLEKAEHDRPAASSEAEHEVPAAEQAEGEEPAAAEAELEAPEGLSSSGGDSPVLVEHPQASEGEPEALLAEAEAPSSEPEAPSAEPEAPSAEPEAPSAEPEAPSSGSRQAQAVLANGDEGHHEQEQPVSATAGSSAQPGAVATECPVDVKGMLEKAAAQAGSSQEVGNCFDARSLGTGVRSGRHVEHLWTSCCNTNAMRTSNGAVPVNTPSVQCFHLHSCFPTSQTLWHLISVCYIVPLHVWYLQSSHSISLDAVLRQACTLEQSRVL